MTATQGLLINARILGEKRCLELYNRAFELVLEGRVYMDFQGEGSAFKSQFPIPVQTMLSEAAYALQQLNPQKYGHLLQQIKPYFV